MATVGKKLVFITGANTGIGYETVRALVQSPRPYHIFLGSRSVERGREAAEALRAEFPNSPSSAEVIQVDISSDQSINDAFEKVKNGPGYIDALVNNAGPCPKCAPMANPPPNGPYPLPPRPTAETA